MDQPSPLDVEELLEHCIAYLHDSYRDLKACTLVSRHWVNAAQYIVDTIPRNTGTSQHLIRHIRHLDIKHNDSMLCLPKLCSFPFTHLESVLISYAGELSTPVITALQQLLTLPTLFRVKLCCGFSNREDFIQLWDCCSPGIRHLELDCKEPSFNLMPGLPPKIALLSPRGTHKIALESLSMLSTKTLDYRLMQKPCPFDLSHLKVLRTGWRASIPWQSFGPAVQSIEVLDIVVNAGSTTLVLSSFPNLRFLRLFLAYWVPTSTKLSRIAQLLSSIGPANVIRKITVYTEDMESTLCAEIDSKLSSLPMSHPPIVELEMYLHVYEGVWPYFPRLSSENLLRRTDPREIPSFFG
ncbi:hypothetical protein B0H13DRAFT_1999362 [Mycena leptocephala]|nr:hypothetical protein B0H13DRAFT_1999362 [Mycena leptocephala]